MVSTITVNDTGDGIDLIEVGIQGPAGPPGLAAPTVMGNLSMSSINNMSATLIASSRYQFTIGGLYGLKVGSGSTTLTISINGVPVTGLNAIAVTTTAQTVLATGSNVVTVGDEVEFTTSGGGAGTDFKFTMGGSINL